MRAKLIRLFALLSNVALLLFCGGLFVTTYGADRLLVVLLFLPPVFSLMALYHAPDWEERKLQNRLRKALLRKELDALSAFDGDKV